MASIALQCMGDDGMGELVLPVMGPTMEVDLGDIQKAHGTIASRKTAALKATFRIRHGEMVDGRLFLIGKLSIGFSFSATIDKLDKGGKVVIKALGKTWTLTVEQRHAKGD